MEISIKPGTPPEKVFTERSGSKYDEAIKTAIKLTEASGFKSALLLYS